MTDDTDRFLAEAEPPEITDEQIYDTLKQYEAAGVIRYILPTEPLGEEWILGVPDGLGGLMKLKGKDQAVGWLAGAATVAHWARDQHREPSTLFTAAALSRRQDDPVPDAPGPQQDRRIIHP